MSHPLYFSMQNETDLCLVIKTYWDRREIKKSALLLVSRIVNSEAGQHQCSAQKRLAKLCQVVSVYYTASTRLVQSQHLIKNPLPIVHSSRREQRKATQKRLLDVTQGPLAYRRAPSRRDPRLLMSLQKVSCSTKGLKKFHTFRPDPPELTQPVEMAVLGKIVYSWLLKREDDRTELL